MTNENEHADIDSIALRASQRIMGSGGGSGGLPQYQAKIQCEIIAAINEYALAQKQKAEPVAYKIYRKSTTGVTFYEFTHSEQEAEASASYLGEYYVGRDALYLTQPSLESTFKQRIAELEAVIAKKDNALVSLIGDKTSAGWLGEIDDMIFQSVNYSDYKIIERAIGNAKKEVSEAIALKPTDMKPAQSPVGLELTSLKVLHKIREILGVGDKPMMTELPDVLRNILEKKSPVVPEGWQLVPKEPTQEMIISGNCSDGKYFTNEDIYKKMLSAAQKD